MSQPDVTISVQLGYPDATFARLADPEGQILTEITDPAMKRLDVAKTYGIILHSGDIGNVDWPRVNAAILDRWSLGSLTWIKRFAWKMGVPGAGQRLSLFERLAAEGRCYKPGDEDA